jgi:hypothetical protein
VFFNGPSLSSIYNGEAVLLNVTEVIALYAACVSTFFQSVLAPNGTIPITMTLETGINDLGKPFFDPLSETINLILINSTDGQQLANITFDVLDQSCEIYPIPREQLSALFGLPEEPQFCSILGSMFFLWYWVALGDLGETMDLNSDGTVAIPGEESHNIFVNETLFERYNDFMNEVALPFVFSGYAVHFTALPLSDSNKAPDTGYSLMKSYTCTHYTCTHYTCTHYTCTQRQLKGVVTFFISVAAADTALILGGYNLFSFVASCFQKMADHKYHRTAPD